MLLGFGPVQVRERIAPHVAEQLPVLNGPRVLREHPLDVLRSVGCAENRALEAHPIQEPHFDHVLPRYPHGVH